MTQRERERVKKSTTRKERQRDRAHTSAVFFRKGSFKEREREREKSKGTVVGGRIGAIGCFSTCDEKRTSFWNRDISARE